MSQLEPGQEVKYKIFKAKIVACTSPAPTPWYKDWIGKTVEVQRRAYYQDGKFTGASYWVSTSPDCRWCGSIQVKDLDEIPHDLPAIGEEEEG